MLEVDDALAKPNGLKDEQWQAAQQAIMRRRKQLEERLAEGDDRFQRPDSAETIICRLLQAA